MRDDVAARVEEVRGGRSRDAEAALCADFLPAARQFFRRHAPQPDVEDLAQEAMLVFLTAAREGRILEGDRPGAYLLGVCRNLVRRGARRDERTGRALARMDLDVVLPSEPLLDKRRLWACFNTLSARVRQVLQLTYVEEVSAAEIAQRTSTTEGNVRIMRHRALQALHVCVEGGRHAP